MTESHPHASASFTATLARIQETLDRTSHDEILLRDDAWPSILKRIYVALDTGKAVKGAGEGRGLPMDVVVQTLKAAWHVDGTWPIGPNALKQLEEDSKERAEKEKGPVAKQDPSPDEIARAYRGRGIEVGDVDEMSDDW